MTIESAPMTDTETSAVPQFPTHEMGLAGFYKAQEAAVRDLPLYDKCVRVYQAMHAAAPKPQGDDLEPVADDLVERLRAHEGIGAAMAPTHGTGRYVCAIMDEAASALQSLKAERDAALRIINMSPKRLALMTAEIEIATLKRERATLREATLEEAAKVIEEGFHKAVGESYRNDGKPSKNDKCPHGRYHYEDCDQCCADAVRALSGREVTWGA